MRRGAWIALAVVVLAAVLAAMGSAAFLLWDLPKEIGTLSINGHVVDLPRAHVGHWLLAKIGRAHV